MKIDALPSHCEVMGCHRPATHSYLHALYARLAEFSTCADHYRQLMRGAAPLFVEEPFDAADLDGRPVLPMGRPDDPDDGIVA